MGNVIKLRKRPLGIRSIRTLNYKEVCKVLDRARAIGRNCTDLPNKKSQPFVHAAGKFFPALLISVPKFSIKSNTFNEKVWVICRDKSNGWA